MNVTGSFEMLGTHPGGTSIKHEQQFFKSFQNSSSLMNLHIVMAQKIAI